MLRLLLAMVLVLSGSATAWASDVSHTVVIKINGVDVSSYVLYERTNFQSLADGQPGLANLVLEDPSHDLSASDVRAGMTLELLVDGTREWDGWVFKVGRGWPFEAQDTAVPDAAPRFWIISGYDRNLLFQKRFMYRVADPTDNTGFRIWDTGTSDKTAIDYAVANYIDLSGDGIDTSSGISAVASPGPYEDFTLGFVSAPFGVLFDDAAKITGAVFYIGPDRVLYYVDDLTVTAPAILSDVQGAGRIQYREVNAALDYNQAASEALVWGAGKGSANPVFAKYTDDAAVAAYGLWQWGDIYVGAWKQQTVNRRARTYVEGSASHRRGHNDPVPVVTATVFEQGFRVGQVATFESDVFGYSQALPIRKATITFPVPTQPRWDLELTLRVDAPFGVPDLWTYRWPRYTYPDIDIPIGGTGPTYEVPGAAAGNLVIDHYDDDFGGAVLSSGVWTNGDGDIAVDLPPVRPVGKFIVLDMAWDGYHIPTGPYANLAVGLWDDSDFWLPMNLAGTGERWVSPDFEHAVYYRRIVGDEGDTLFFTPDSYEEVGQTAVANWSIVAHVQDLSPDDFDTQYLESVVSDAGNTWSGIGGTVPSDGYWRSMLNVLTNSTDLTDIPSEWVLIGTSEVSGEVQVYSFAKDWGYLTNGSDITAETDWPGSPAFTNGIGFYHHLVKVQSDAVPAEGYLGSDELVTPGPEVTEAPWTGGNPYHRTYSTLPSYARVANSIISREGATTLSFSLYDEERFLIDDSEYFEDPNAIPGTAYGDVDPGYYHDGYPAGGWSTRYWAKADGFDDVIPDDDLDIIIKWRYTGAGMPADARMHVYTELFSIPDSQDQLDVWKLAMFLGWGHGIGDTYIQSWINIYDTGNGPDGSIVWPYHAYYYPALGPTPRTYVRDTWYYTRIKVGKKNDPAWGHPHAAGYDDSLYGTGLAMAGVKTWLASEEEPTDGTSGDFSWYWSGPTNDYPDVFNGEEVGNAVGGWDIVLPTAWVNNGWMDPVFDVFDYDDYIGSNLLQVRSFDAGVGQFEVDAIWRYGGGVATTETVYYGGPFEGSGLVVYVEDSATTVATTYRTFYPYDPGSLDVWLDGIRLRPDFDFAETDPENGTFTILETEDVSSGLYVRYYKSSNQPTTG